MIFLVVVIDNYEVTQYRGREELQLQHPGTAASLPPSSCSVICGWVSPSWFSKMCVLVENGCWGKSSVLWDHPLTL